MKKIFLFLVMATFCFLLKPEPSWPAHQTVNRHKLVYRSLIKIVGAQKTHELLNDPRLTIHSEIYKPKDKKTKERISYFSEEFGMFKTESFSRGKKFLAENRLLLNRISNTYNVEPEVIAAIIRIETNFGKNLGAYRVFNGLYTMAIHAKRPKRLKFAVNELTTLVKQCLKEKKDPFNIFGSWAGAFGLTQFIPSSYKNFKVDFDNDGVVDLFSVPDACATTANYLNRNGWQNGNTAKMRKAIWAYNHEQEYVDAVLAYAKILKEGVNEKPLQNSSL